jgi:hypothetical protein
VRFDVNTQSLLSVIDRTLAVDAGKTINMQLAVKNQTNPAKLFITQPWAIAFKQQVNEGYVTSAASNIVVKVALSAVDGTPAVQSDPLDAGRVLQIKVGKNPRGIVVNSTNTRAYVMNYVSRDVSVIDLTSTPEHVMATVVSAPQPAPGSREELVQIGKELYNTSVGEFDPAVPGGAPIVGRMSRNGWGACFRVSHAVRAFGQRGLDISSGAAPDHSSEHRLRPYHRGAHDHARAQLVGRAR